MSGLAVTRHLLNITLQEQFMSDQHSLELWKEVRARLTRLEAFNVIEAVEACADGNLDHKFRDTVTDVIAHCLVGTEYWPLPYPGSTFEYDLLKALFTRGYMVSDGTIGECYPRRFKIDCFDGRKHFKQEVVPSSRYDILEAEVVELRRQLAERGVDEENKLAADRWKALMSSDRMRILGSSGFKPSTIEGANQAHLAGHRHFGCDMWSHHDTPGEETGLAQAMFTTYADHLIELNKNGRKPQ